MKKECSEIVDHKEIVFKENRSKLSILNPNRLIGTRVEVDGCEITEGIRCDFLLLIKSLEMFIELKGQDIHHAIEQLERTMSLLSEDLRKQKKIAFVICTRSPINSATIQNLRVNFKKKYNADLLVKSTPYKYKI